MANFNQPLSKFLVERRRELRADYPEADADEIRMTLHEAKDQWFQVVTRYGRGDIVPPGVFMSYRYHLGHAETTRAFRYAGNFAQLARLPQP